MPINLRNSRGRDGKVGLESVKQKRVIRYLDTAAREVKPVRLLKCDIGHNLNSLLEKFNDLENLYQNLSAIDPEVDLDLFGKYLSETTKVYVSKNQVVFHVNEIEVVLNPDGTERERKPLNVEPQNINTDTPLVWSGRFIKKADAVRKFVFTSMKQIVHVNGLTYDFLYEMAKELHDRESFMILGSGAKGEKPLTLQRGGKNFRGFLEGRIDENKYCLLLHLSDLELKMPKVEEEKEVSDAESGN